ncbi:MAG: nitroreductase family protein [Phycisphaerales bacterium]
MRTIINSISVLFLMLGCSSVCFSQNPPAADTGAPAAIIKLPQPKINGVVSLEQALENRRSIRQFTDEALTIDQIGQICWAAQGVTEPNREFRTAPSPGAIYPIQLYVFLPDGLYLYAPARHELSLVIDKDLRLSIFNSSFNQRVVQKAPCTFMLAGDVKKVEAKYRSRGERFTYIEAGHIAQNIQLQATALALGSVPIGVIDTKTIAQICKLPIGQEVIYLIPVGNPTKKPALANILQPAPAAPVITDLRSKHVAIIVPNKYFNDTDFYGVQQALTKEGIQPVIASTTIGEVKGIQVMGIQRNILTSTVLLRDLKLQDFDAFVFVGGAGFGGNFLNNVDTINLVRSASSAGKIIAGISESPGIFAYADIVRGKNVTSSTSQRTRLVQAGAKWQRNLLVVDGNLITAGDSTTSAVVGSPNVGDRFGTAVINILKGEKITY